MKQKKIFGDLISTVTMAVLFLVILILVVFSAMTYQRSVEISDQNGNARAVLSYVVTAVRANASGTVTVEDRDGRAALIIADEATGYEQRIFFRDGQVLETYGFTGSEIYEEDAMVIGEAERFEIGFLTDELLEIRTDMGNSCVRIRNRG